MRLLRSTRAHRECLRFASSSHCLAAVLVLLGPGAILAGIPADGPQKLTLSMDPPLKAAPPEMRLVVTGCILAPVVGTVEDDGDDGTEVNATWMADGYAEGMNCVGSGAGDIRFVSGLRFRVSDISEGDSVVYVRLRLPFEGCQAPSGLELKLVGVADVVPDPFSQERRPSVLPRTQASVAWTIPGGRCTGRRQPPYIVSPNLAPIVNELIALPSWGRATETRVISIMIEPVDGGTPETGCVRFEDYASGDGSGDAAMLELFPAVWDALVGKPMLGRPTDHSITISCLSLLPVDVFVEYGTASGSYSTSTEPLLGHPAMEPIEIGLDGLRPDTEYHYRLRYRLSGRGEYEAADDAVFRTQRSNGSPFVFTVQADSHIHGGKGSKRDRRAWSYVRTLLNVLQDKPDFHLDLGDFAMTESIGGQSAASGREALERYLCQRKFLGLISHSVPFYLVLGNHEGEQGWRALNPRDSLEIWSTLARKTAIPNPCPDGFYSGNLDTTFCCGLREDYFAWEWGDALFVVIDPYWYTPYGKADSHTDGREYLGHGSRTAWEWTLGADQYNWLYEVLNESEAEWKFVFSHQLVGGFTADRRGYPYGRGGADAAKFKVAGHGSYEWGGEDAAGNYVFAEMRPGWQHGPIHDMMVDAGVDIFFHGHDHAFVYEVLDGIVYQACPVPRAGSGSGTGFYNKERYSTGIVRPNWGHIRVSVWPDSARVDYVRSALAPEDARVEAGRPVPNRSVAYSYTLSR